MPNWFISVLIGMFSIVFIIIQLLLRIISFVLLHSDKLFSLLPVPAPRS